MTDPVGNYWWITARTGDGAVHLWQIGYTEADTAEEVDAACTAIRGLLGFPDNWVDAGGWDLAMAPGRPTRYFTASVRDDGTVSYVPNDGVTVHDQLPV